MEPVNYLQALRRRWPIIAIATLIGAAAAFLATPAKPTPVERTYVATQTLVVADPNLGADQLVGTVTLAQVPLFTTTGEVPRRVAEELGWSGPPAELAAQVQATMDAQTGTLRISSQQADPQRAVQLADAFGDETVTFLAERQEAIRQSRLSATLARLDALKADADRLDAQLAADPENELITAQRDAAVRAYGATYESYQDLTLNQTADLNLTTLERAQPVPVDAGGFTAPRSRATRVPLAAGIGFLLGVGLALLIDRFDGRLRDRRAVEEAYGVPVVGELPSLRRRERSQGLLVGPDEHSPSAEAYRTLRTALSFVSTEGGRRATPGMVVLVASSSPSDGKTTVAANLAAAYAEAGQSVIVVNADFRRPRLARFFRWWADDAPPSDADLSTSPPREMLVTTTLHGLLMLDLSRYHAPAGELARATARIVEQVRSTVDVVVIDTPPLSVTAEALEFAPTATVSLLVARLDRSTQAGATRTSELLRFAGAARVMVVITEAGRPGSRQYQYYGYYAREKGSKPSTNGKAPAPPAAESPPPAGATAHLGEPW